MTEVLHQIAQFYPSLRNKQKLLADLDASDRQLAKLSDEAHTAAGERLWSDLKASASTFTQEAHRVLEPDVPVPREKLETLFTLHNHVVRSNLSKGTSHDLDALRGDCLHLVDESIANVRELSQLLRPVILDDFGLDAGLRWLTEKFSQRTRLQVDYGSSCVERFADETETHLYRIAQEALTNIARHSEATQVAVSLSCTDGFIRLTIEDNGKGLQTVPDLPDPHPSLGMVGMRARARQCGGELSVTAVEPHGVCIEAAVPASNGRFG